MLVRDGDDAAASLEVLMVRRNLNSDFVGGAYVFPGGAVDPADSGTEAEACCQGRGDAEASEILGVGSGGLAYWVAALRECFEEAGLLLAYTRGGSLLSLADPDTAAQFLGYRAGVNDGTIGFLDVCRQESLSLAVDRVHYFAHWATPEGAPRRYDTRFFVAVAPPDQTAAHDAGEMVADEWVRPADALARYESGEIEMVIPTVRSLQDIGRFRTADELVAAAAAAAVTVPTVEPHVMIEGRGVRIPLPGDPGYQAATGARAPTL
jgi:8-oxo-dGTP pyrophosphatase MutT (NUDIX family)